MGVVAKAGEFMSPKSSHVPQLQAALAVEMPPFRPNHHGPQDYQSLLMHKEAVRMIQNDPALADKALSILMRWDTHVSVQSKPLRDRWVQILQEKDWVLAVEDSELGNQLRQASPMACLLPNEVRLAIIAHVRMLKDTHRADLAR